MEWLHSLLFGQGIAHTVLVLAVVIVLGVALSRIKVAGISIGTTWILFVGIAVSHFGMTIDADTLHFIKEFGLILFVFSMSWEPALIRQRVPHLQFPSLKPFVPRVH